MASKSPRQLVSKKEIAARYGISVRSVNNWMRRRIIPYIKMSSRMVRFDVEICDVVLKSHEYRSIFDQTIQEEIARLRAAKPEVAQLLQAELGIEPTGRQKNPGDSPA